MSVYLSVRYRNQYPVSYQNLLAYTYRYTSGESLSENQISIGSLFFELEILEGIKCRISLLITIQEKLFLLKLREMDHHQASIEHQVT